MTNDYRRDLAAGLWWGAMLLIGLFVMMGCASTDIKGDDEVLWLPDDLRRAMWELPPVPEGHPEWGGDDS